MYDKKLPTMRIRWHNFEGSIGVQLCTTLMNYRTYEVMASKHDIEFTITIHNPFPVQWLIATLISVSHIHYIHQTKTVCYELNYMLLIK